MVKRVPIPRSVSPRFVTSRVRNRWTVFENYRSDGTSENCPPIPHFAVFIMVSWRRSGRKKKEGKRKGGRSRKARKAFRTNYRRTVAQRRAQGYMAPWLLRPIIRTNLIICLFCSSFSRLPHKEEKKKRTGCYEESFRSCSRKPGRCRAARS